MLGSDSISDHRYQLRAPVDSPELGSTRRFFHPIVWLTCASSSVVLIEPSPNDVLTVLLFALFCATGLPSPKQLSFAVLLLLLFLLGNVIASIAIGLELTLIRSLLIRCYLVAGWLTVASYVSAFGSRGVDTIFSGYTIAALLALTVAIGQYYGAIPGLSGGPDIRAAGLFKDPNVYGPFLVPVALLQIYNLHRYRGARFLTSLVILLAVIAGIFLAFSRGAWINLAVSTAVFCLSLILLTGSNRQKFRFLLMLAVGLSMVAALVYWIVTETPAGNLFFERFSIVQQYDVAENGRFAAQVAAIRVIGTNPFGIGPGMAAAVMGLEPHNIYLHVALEAGWLGAISLFIFVVATFWIGFKSVLRIDPHLKFFLFIALAALFGTLVQSLFIDSTHWRHMWLLFALIWGISSTADGSINRSVLQ